MAPLASWPRPNQIGSPCRRHDHRLVDVERPAVVAGQPVHVGGVGDDQQVDTGLRHRRARFVRRSAYSVRENFRFGALMSCFVSSLLLASVVRITASFRSLLLSAFECCPRPSISRAIARERGDRGVLHACPGEIGNGDLVVRGPTGLCTRDYLPEFGKDRILANNPGFDCRPQFAEQPRLGEPIREIEVGAADDARIELVLVLGIRPHCRYVLAG